MDYKVIYIHFKVGDKFLIKVNPMKKVMRFAKTGKLIPWYIGPFENPKDVCPIGYKLALS